MISASPRFLSSSCKFGKPTSSGIPIAALVEIGLLIIKNIQIIANTIFFILFLDI